MALTLLGARAGDFSGDGYLIKNWSTADGLPENTVRAILQTRDGYLWAGTSGGVARFDGIRFTVFTSGNTPELLSDNIWDMHEDRTGIIWLATSRGLARYQAGRFRFFGPKDGMTTTYVSRVLETIDGTVWALSGDLWKWTGERMEKVELRNGPRPWKILDLAKRREDGLWLAEETGLSRLVDGTVERVLDVEQLVEIEASETGDVWILQFPGRLWQWRQGRVENQIKLTEEPCQALRVLPNGDVWVGAKDLNHAFRVREGRVLEVNEGQGLEGNRPIAFLEDREGNVWIGINRGGLFRLRERQLRVFGRQDGLPILFVNGIAQDREGGIQLALMGANPHRMVGDRFEVAFSGEPGNPFYYGTAMLPAREGGVWAGTFYGRLARVQEGRVAEEIGADAGTRSLMMDRDGRLWRGTRQQGVEVFDGEKVTRYAVTNGLSFNDIYAMAQDRSGAIWVGTERGLNRIWEGRLDRYGTAEGLTHASILALLLDSRGTLWIGTSGAGLTAWDGDHFTTITAQDGLAAESVQQILEDDFGRLWIGTRAGLLRVGVEELHAFLAGRAGTVNATRLGRDEGVARPRFGSGYQPSAIKDRQGRLWFCSNSGVVQIDPAKHMAVTPAPRVHIERISLDGRTVRTGADLHNLVSVPAGTERLEFGYTGLHYSMPEQVRFRYRLVGHDRRWVEAHDQRQASYSQLHPGRYEFQVQAANHDGVWTTESAALGILMEPAFWQTFWFRAAMALGLAALLLAAYRMRIAQWDRRRIAQEDFSRKLIESQEMERQRIAGELHDSIGQNLLVIRNLALMGMDAHPDHASIHDQFGEISETAGQGLAEVRSISHALRPVELDRLGLTKSITAAGQRISETSDIRMDMEIDPIDGLLAEGNEINFYRIVQECLNNIVKHSGAETALIELKHLGHRLQLVIGDDGRGFDASSLEDPSSSKPGLGLRSIVERARAMGGTTAILSQPGKGTRIEVSLPLN